MHKKCTTCTRIIIFVVVIWKFLTSKEEKPPCEFESSINEEDDSDYEEEHETEDAPAEPRRQTPQDSFKKIISKLFQLFVQII